MGCLYSWVFKNLPALSTQLYPRLHYLDIAFFILRIQILNFLVRFIFNRKWLCDFPMKENVGEKVLCFENLKPQISEQLAN